MGMHIVNPGSGVSATGPAIRVTMASQDEYQVIQLEVLRNILGKLQLFF